MQLAPLLSLMIELNATDLHLTSGVPPVVRANRSLFPAPNITESGSIDRARAFPNLTYEQIRELLIPILSPQQQETLERDRMVRAVAVHEGSHFTVTIFGGSARWSAVIHRLISSPPLIQKLNMPVVFTMMIKKPQGLILLAGLAGSGRSITAAAIINNINNSITQRILTIESNPAFLFTSKMSLVTQLLVGLDLESAVSGLRLAKEYDTNVVYVDDLSDSDAVCAALDLADAGCLVIARMAAKDTSTAIQRLIDQSSDASASVRARLSQHLVSVIAQQMIPFADGGGRRAVYEILLGTPSVKALIAAGERNLRSAMGSAREKGMITMEDALREQYHRGFITRETMQELLEGFTDDVDDKDE